MLKRKCEICGLKSRREDGVKRFFMARFPLNKDRCKEWVKVTGNEDLAYIPIEKLHELKFVCGKHFLDKDFNAKKTRLKHFAISSVRLAAKPLCDETLKQFPCIIYKECVKTDTSINGLRKMLSICERYAEAHGLRYNASKSELLVFRAGTKYYPIVPPLSMKGTTLKIVPQFKYLGHWVTASLSDDMDLERERRALAVPQLVCREGEFRALLERDVPLLREPYWPTPWCVEARLQTVLGSVLRSLFLAPLQFRREILRLSDGGQVALDWLDAEEQAGAARPVLLVLPGLTGGAQADYVRCLCAAARELGASAVVFSNRGLGGVPLTTPRLYCAVSHADLAEVVAAVRARAAGPLLAAGVSLGGLILGQYLAERGARAQVHAAFIVSSPLDVIKGAECMERRPLNALLSWHMARNLRRTVLAHATLRGDGAGECDWGGLARSRTVRQFDAAFTARHFGFASVDAYYRAATLRDKLCAVRVPTLCLQAADDPFQPARVLPRREAARSERVALAVTARGGHIGFLDGWWPAHAARSQYIARLAHQYFAALLRDPALLHRPEPEP